MDMNADAEQKSASKTGKDPERERFWYAHIDEEQIKDESGEEHGDEPEWDTMHRSPMGWHQSLYDSWDDDASNSDRYAYAEPKDICRRDSDTGRIKPFYQLSMPKVCRCGNTDNKARLDQAVEAAAGNRAVLVDVRGLATDEGGDSSEDSNGHTE